MSKMNKLEELVSGLKTCQEREKLSDTKFAKRLGIDVSLWTFIKNGKREPGAKVIKGITRGFPELDFILSAWLKDKGNGNKKESNGNRD